MPSRYSAGSMATSNVLAWGSHLANVESLAEEDAAAEADEPPDLAKVNDDNLSTQFSRALITRSRENHASLLTKALQSATDGELCEINVAPVGTRRRRSITSQTSSVSTADLTSDTGTSTPARTSSPSPPCRGSGFVAVTAGKHAVASRVRIMGSPPRASAPVNQREDASELIKAPNKPAADAVAKKRCISFACAAKPKDHAPIPKGQSHAAAGATTPAATESALPRKACIRFACTANPSTRQSPPQKHEMEMPRAVEGGSRSTEFKTKLGPSRSPAPPRARLSPQNQGQADVVARNIRFLTADSRDLANEICHFHEFASDHPTQEDWIVQEMCVAKTKLTLNDLLKKENDIRRLGKEAEEEAEQEEEDDDEEAVDEDDEEENVDDEDEMGGDEEMEDESECGSDDDLSEGYHSDEECGFAESDDEEDDGLHLWTFRGNQTGLSVFQDAPNLRHWSLRDHPTDSCIAVKPIHGKHSPPKPGHRSATPELPDSTDFVCGTMDEDRPVEEEYMTCLAARKLEKLRVIPQDIDPSFPASEPDDDDDAHEEAEDSNVSGDHLWLHGELEELEEERADRRHRKGDVISPKRCHSPPPKRLRSPPPKVRGRSPRRILDRSSPKRIRSPAPGHGKRLTLASPGHADKAMDFKLLAEPTHTKSLPRAAYFPPQPKSGKKPRPHPANKASSTHVRGAIDIVKGLEHKRQRRKEKFFQKYCDRARKGQIPEKKAQPGEGAERMRELGLLLAGKMGQGNFVISV